MTKLELGGLNGIPVEYRESIFQAMRSCSNSQRLLVCLYFLQDRNGAHLSEIESTLRQIFPPALGSGLLPDKYRDFQATAIRQYFNFETKAVREGIQKEPDRMWNSPFRGYWKNTELDNKWVLGVLHLRNLTISMNNQVVKVPEKATTPMLPYFEKEEEMAEVARHALTKQKLGSVDGFDSTASPDTTSTQKPNSQRNDLVTWTIKVIENLPEHDPMAVAEENNISISFGGTAEEVASALRALKNTLKVRSIEVNLRMDSDGCLVRVSSE